MTKPSKNKPQTFVTEHDKQKELTQILKTTGGNVKSSVDGIQDMRPIRPPRPLKKHTQR